MTDTLVISGASKGIGRATAALFQTQGFRIVNISRSNCPLDNVVQVTADLADPLWPDSQGPDAGVYSPPLE